jgi:hypothetical protein
LAERFTGREGVFATDRASLPSANLVETERALVDAAVRRAGEGIARLAAPVVEQGERALTVGQAAALREVVCRLMAWM